ncbi:hypothetical protein [Streptomyces xinghaiensis]|uniref:hypothetical protein n=1 Tax=Streptomyces xinghaiensis TaxID=1038928 RepID=UPI0002F29851|nr:hypothetical protein [Streptomyces xinghaiensis]MZE80030.1 hypothetical protein [Streptomyces sp. SID5475]
MSPEKPAAASLTTLARLWHVLRHPRWYARRCGFGTFQILVLPAVTTGSLLTALYLGHPR